MCLIIIKKKGKKLVPHNMLEKVWEKNPDGAGIIYKKDNHPYKMIKGLMSLNQLTETISQLNLTKDDWIAYHLRYATSGDIDEKTTHPFVVHEDINFINALSVNESKKTLMVMHNGTIYSLNDNNAKLCDTQRFVKDYLCNIKHKDLFHNKTIKKLIESFIDESRLLLVHGTEGYITYGKWHEHKGYILSKPYRKAIANNVTCSLSSTHRPTLFQEEEGIANCQWCGSYQSTSYIHTFQQFVCQQCKTDFNLF